MVGKIQTQPKLLYKSLYEVIEVEHEGAEADQLYLCTRDSGTALSHPLSALVGLYVEQVNK